MRAKWYNLLMISDNRQIIIKARSFARTAHKHITITTVSGDVRQQIEHLQEVADLVWASGGTDAEIAAAWLHDSLEDTSVTLIDIENEFGAEVMETVKGLTDADDLSGLSNAERKPKQAERIKDKNQSVKRIKIADQISNIRFVTTDPKQKWSFESNKDYIVGAKLITDQCRGISNVLDELFDVEYKKSVEYFKI